MRVLHDAEHIAEGIHDGARHPALAAHSRGLERGRAPRERTFRVDRMSSVASTGTAFQLPAGFDLAAAWDSISAELEVRRSGTQADITLPAALVGPLRDVLGARHVEEVEVGTDGRIHLRVTSNTTEMLARQLAGWAPEVDVVGPPEVRAALAEIGKELSSRYQS